MRKHGQEFVLGLVRVLNLSQERGVAFLGPLLLRDVGTDAQDALGGARLIEKHDRPIADPADGTFGTDESKFDVVWRFSRKCSTQCQINSLHVIAVEVLGQF